MSPVIVFNLLLVLIISGTTFSQGNDPDMEPRLQTEDNGMKPETLSPTKNRPKSKLQKSESKTGKKLKMSNKPGKDTNSKNSKNK